MVHGAAVAGVAQRQHSASSRHRAPAESQQSALQQWPSPLAGTPHPRHGPAPSAPTFTHPTAEVAPAPCTPRTLTTCTLRPLHPLHPPHPPHPLHPLQQPTLPAQQNSLVPAHPYHSFHPDSYDASFRQGNTPHPPCRRSGRAWAHPPPAPSLSGTPSMLNHPDWTAGRCTAGAGCAAPATPPPPAAAGPPPASARPHGRPSQPPAAPPPPCEEARKDSKKEHPTSPRGEGWWQGASAPGLAGVGWWAVRMASQ